MTFAEDGAFRHWAAVEFLRDTGRVARIYSGCLNIRPLPRPNGEIVALRSARVIVDRAWQPIDAV